MQRKAPLPAPGTREAGRGRPLPMGLLYNTSPCILDLRAEGPTICLAQAAGLGGSLITEQKGQRPDTLPALYKLPDLWSLETGFTPKLPRLSAWAK